MTVVVVSAPNSYEKQVKYNVNQQLLAVTQGSVPGLQEEIKEYPKSIVGAIKKALQSDSGLAFLGLQTVTQNLTSLDMSKGYIVDSNMNIYFIEQLTLTPTSESFWGFYEIEISEEDSDELTLGFVNPSTSPKTFYTSNGYTKKKYKVSIYENYNTTAEFPTLTAGRTKWVEYKKDAAFGNIVSNTNYLKTKFVLNTDVQDSLTSTETEKPLSDYQGKLINDSFLIGEIKAWDK
ncbi:MAG: hypothetical protein KDK36_06605 [Leptospiraceae bacterium]|nr:hypothetical protein [Leptospiraceae bacterium]